MKARGVHVGGIPSFHNFIPQESLEARFIKILRKERRVGLVDIIYFQEGKTLQVGEKVNMDGRPRGAGILFYFGRGEPIGKETSQVKELKSWFPFPFSRIRINNQDQQQGSHFSSTGSLEQPAEQHQ